VPTISKLDFVAIPSRDAERSRTFYGETLGLRADANAQYEFWAGETCLGIWEPEKLGMPFSPQKNGHLALHVGRVAVMQHQVVAVRVGEERHVAHAGVHDVARELDASGLQLGPRGGDVVGRLREKGRPARRRGAPLSVARRRSRSCRRAGSRSTGSGRGARS
jgi:catechol 2,3-dioxygenase-like lactoylglutathione lyase family enzyme